VAICTPRGSVVADLQRQQEVGSESAPLGPIATRSASRGDLHCFPALLAAAVSLHFAFHNFCRVHKTLGTTPAVAAGGISDHPWKISKLIGLLEEAEAVAIKRGRYAKTRERRAQQISD
jgi:hypothetical protein